MKKPFSFLGLLACLLGLAGCRAEQPRLLPEGTVTAVAVNSLPGGYDYSFAAEDAQAVADYLSGLTLTAKFPENPNEYSGMTWVIQLSYENGNTVTVYHFGNLFIRADDGPWYKMNYQEANRLGTLLHELDNTALSNDEQKWNLMWDLWVAGEAESPYAELMTYESEVNNCGHSQYFFNVANSGDLRAAVQTILPVLPQPLRENLQRGYAAFAAQKDISDDDNEDLFAACDDLFYENEQLILDILRAYANTLNQ